MERRHCSKKPDWNSHIGQPSLGLYDASPNGVIHSGYETFVAQWSSENSFSPDNDDEDNLVFLNESEDENNDTITTAPWKILIADDDSNVHDTTVLALSGVQIHGKPLEFLHAFSAKEARDVVANNPDMSLILLDVVMETVDAGLKLVHVLRDELSCKELRIVLRTGQPGYAKENIMSSYAIDGYATKSKLTRSILISMLSEILETAKPEGSLPN
jgi:CheY-like chemotaxis protein